MQWLWVAELSVNKVDECGSVERLLCKYDQEELIIQLSSYITLSVNNALHSVLSPEEDHVVLFVQLVATAAPHWCWEREMETNNHAQQ